MLLLIGTFAVGAMSSAPALGPTSPCLILATSSSFPSIDLEVEVDDFVQSIPFSGGYADPQGKISTRNAIVSGFKEARDGNPSEHEACFARTKPTTSSKSARTPTPIAA